jgi:hypothetical protein
MGFILKEKLKGLKETLKVWNKEVYGEIDTKISFLVEEIKEKDLRGEVGSLSAEEVVLRRKHFFDLWHLLNSKELSAVQRSRSRWLKEGDANSRYFHSVMNSRGKRNRIMALEVGGEWSEDPLIIRQEAVSFFKNQFQNPQWQRPQLDGVPFSLVSQGENDSLIQPFSLER